jgi:hypothetical protein
MATTIEYERMTNSIISSNLSTSGEPSPSNNADSPSGFLAELYLGPRIETQSSLANSNWHIHYRE